MEVIVPTELKNVVGAGEHDGSGDIPWWVPVLGDIDHLPPGFPGTPGGPIFPPGTF